MYYTKNNTHMYIYCVNFIITLYYSEMTIIRGAMCRQKLYNSMLPHFETTPSLSDTHQNTTIGINGYYTCMDIAYIGKLLNNTLK